MQKWRPLHIYVKNFTDYLTADSDNILWRTDALTGKCLQTHTDTKAAAMQLHGKHVAGATNTHSIIELMLETVFSTWSVQSGHKEDNWSD
jgi:hypothetical protein